RPGCTCEPEARVILPLTVPLPLSVCRAPRVNVELRPETLKVVPDARLILVVAAMVAVPLSANVPPLIVVVLVHVPAKFGPRVTVPPVALVTGAAGAVAMLTFLPPPSVALIWPLCSRTEELQV